MDSYCAADRKVDGVEMVCEWVSVEEYANREQLDIEVAYREADSGRCGKMITQDGIKYVIWPKTKQSLSADELPKFGMKEYQVKISQKIQSQAQISNPSIELSVALTNQTPKTMEKFIAQATQSLNNMCFLSVWSAFEIFIRDTVYFLIEFDPSRCFLHKKFANKSITYQELLENSSLFKSIDQLKSFLAETIIAEQEKGHQSISALINMIRECYLKDSLLYDTWYVLNGEKKQTSYAILSEIKEARNSLIHAGTQEANDKETTPKNIDRGTYTEYVLILRAIAHNIASSIQKELL